MRQRQYRWRFVAAKLAHERSNDAQVKQAAQMMEQDHPRPIS